MQLKECLKGGTIKFKGNSESSSKKNSLNQTHNDNYIEMDDIEGGVEGNRSDDVTGNSLKDLIEAGTLGIQLQRSNTKLKRVILTLFVLALVALIQNLAGSLSCTDDSFTKCYPQFTLRVRQGSLESSNPLSGIREGLKTISYFAKDLSVNLNGKTNSFANRPHYLDIIDTFSDHNIYKFNFNGYCRENTIYNTEYCVYSNGLDIFSSLIKDIGLQLGNVSKVENPLELGESLVTTYSQALIDLNELYEKGERSEPGFDDLDMISLGWVHKIKYIETFASIMSLCSLLSVIISVLLVIHNSFLVLSFASTNKLSNTIQSNLLGHLIVHLFFVIVHLLSHVTLVVCEAYFYEMLASFLDQINIAIVNTGSGFNFLVANVVILLVMVVLIAVVLSKNWARKYKH